MKYAERQSVPNPGSDEALEMGCTCAVIDNHYGQRVPWPGGWWITHLCPVHDIAPPPSAA